MNDPKCIDRSGQGAVADGTTTVPNSSPSATATRWSASEASSEELRTTQTYKAKTKIVDLDAEGAGGDKRKLENPSADEICHGQRFQGIAESVRGSSSEDDLRETAAGDLKIKEGDEDEGNDKCCPICLGEPLDNDTVDDNASPLAFEAARNLIMVQSPCNHEYCLSCVERILTLPAPTTRRNNNIVDGDLHLNVPTHGRCPICRSEINLFELRHARTKCAGSDDGDNFVVQKDHNIANSPIQGMVFGKYRCSVGDESFHFPSSTDGRGGENVKTAQVEQAEPIVQPYLNLENVPEDRIISFWRQGRPSFPMAKKYSFEPGCHFYDRTSTFHGTIRWDKEIAGGKRDLTACCRRARQSPQWDYVLGFSSEFHFISKGTIVARKEVCADPNCKDYDCKFPLDGRWEVTWPDTGACTTILVNGNRFRLNKFDDLVINSDLEATHYLCLFDHQHPRILSANATVLHIASTDIDLKSCPGGPPVGGTIEWKESPNSLTMIWKRKTTTTDCPILEVWNFGSGRGEHQLHYMRMDAQSESTAIACSTYHPDRLWGNSFCQAMTVGLASYHFLENETAYISYEHEHTSQWPSLDNGSPIPTRIYFSEIEHDQDERIFRGKIDWLEVQGTTWQSDRYWRYEMRFSRDYTFISGGHVCSAPLSSTVEQEMSLFVEDLFYINVGKFEQLQTATTRNLNDGYQQTIHDVAEQLDQIADDENSSARASIMARHAMLSLQRTRIHYPSSFGER